MLLGAGVDGLFFFKDVEFVVGSCLGCGESWAGCVGEPMDVDEFCRMTRPCNTKVCLFHDQGIKRGENEVTG